MKSFKERMEAIPVDEEQQKKVDMVNDRIMKDKLKAKEDVEKINLKMQKSMQNADRAVEKFRRKFGGNKNG